MESQRNILFIAMLFLASILWMKWVEFSAPQQLAQQISETQKIETELPQVSQNAKSVSTVDEVPGDASLSQNEPVALPQVTNTLPTPVADLITVKTDLISAAINLQGGILESLSLDAEPIALDQPDQGFPLLKKQANEIALLQSGLVTLGQPAPNHTNTRYTATQANYQLGDMDEINIPLRWVADNGIIFTKTYTFKRNSYLVGISYEVDNQSSDQWQGTFYGQFQSTETVKKGGGFGQLPSYAGAAVYTEEEKYEKISFSNMRDENYQHETQSGWVAMLQHYFVAVWIPSSDRDMTLYSNVSKSAAPVTYRIGYKNNQLIEIQPNETGRFEATAYLGPKTQDRLKKLEKDGGITGLALTVDYGWLTFIADPLFFVLNWINSWIGNWGWSIILLTILIKLVFYPLSAASYKSMAGMKKLQPRIQTLKDRYKDDRQKFQMEMMALYKKEKINPAGGCLPILVQIPVFIALYWVLLESVEMRQAPFALWLQDLSSPDPFYILPVMMGASMWFQQKLNPAPMEDIQKKVMMIMPFALTFLFLNFPSGLVLYWVVNNVLSMAQQWLINRQHAV